MLLVLQAAEQHLVQSHSEVLLVCGVRDKACQWRERERGTVSVCLTPGPYKYNFTRLLAVCTVDCDQCNLLTVMGRRASPMWA